MAELSSKTAFLDALDRCIADVRAGRKTIGQCLDEYPQYRGELAPLLATAAAIVSPRLTLDPAQKLRARYAFVEALHDEASGQPAALGVFARLQRRVAGVAVAAILAVAGSGAAVVAAQDAQPSDPLYGLKTAIEQQQVALAASPDARAELRVRIADRRLGEVERAVAAGRENDAFAAAAAYAQTMQLAYDDIDAAVGSGSLSVGATEAADESLARVPDVAAKAKLAGEQAAAAALLEARERAERERVPTRRGAPAQPPATPGPSDQARESAPPTPVVEATAEPVVAEVAVPPPTVMAVVPPPTAGAGVAPPQPTRPPTQGNANQGPPPQGNASQGRPSGSGREDNRADEQNDDRGRGEANEGSARPAQAQPTRTAQPAAVVSATPTPRSTIAPTAERDNRDGGDDRGGNGRGNDDRRGRASPTPTATALPRAAGSSEDRPRPTATATTRGTSATPTPTPSGGSDGARDGDRDEREGNRGSDRN